MLFTRSTKTRVSSEKAEGLKMEYQPATPTTQERLTIDFATEDHLDKRRKCSISFYAADIEQFFFQLNRLKAIPLHKSNLGK